MRKEGIAYSLFGLYVLAVWLFPYVLLVTFGLLTAVFLGFILYCFLDSSPSGSGDWQSRDVDGRD